MSNRTPVARVSVVTVCLNVRDTIRLTLESVSRQTFTDIDHVIIDGGSTDGTCDIVREYRVGHFTSEKDRGVYDAMDKGAQAAQGDIVIFLNAGDTFYDDDCCADVAAFFDETRADIVFGNLMPVYLDATDSHDHGAFIAGQLLDLGYIVNRRQLYDESIHHQATFYRRWIFKTGRYACEPAPEATGEYNLLLDAVIRQNASVKHISRPIARFVLGGISTRDFAGEWSKYVKARDRLREIYFPQGAGMRSSSEVEFSHVSRKDSAARRRLTRRIQAKGWIKRSPAFRAYDRLMRSQSARTLNPLMERLEEMHSRQSRALEQSTLRARNSAAEGLRDSQHTMIAHLQAESSRLIHAQVKAQGQTEERLQRELAIVRNEIRDLRHQFTQLQMNQADLALRLNTDSGFDANGFRVCSQWNEDGLLQYLITHGGITSRRFVEFGVGDYRESNTRFLLQKDNWVGLILDSSPDNIRSIRNSEIYWRHQLTAVEAFVDAGNVNRVLAEHGMSGDIGLLSIDVDGVDYWIWKAISDVSPQIVICEYNGLFGPDAAITVPYDPAFDRTRKHYSWLYAGASLAALTDLGREKGYTLVGTNSGGNNAFFVRNDVLANGTIQVSATPYTRPMFRESRNPDGSLSYLDIAQGIELIKHLEVHEVRQQRTMTIEQACLSAAG